MSALTQTKKRRFNRVWKYRHYYLLMLPALVYVAIFHYGPMYGVQIAFKDYMGVLGVAGSPWVGFKHFISFFNSFYFFTIFRNTLMLSLYSLVVGFPLPIILALMINELRETKLRKSIQTIMYAPHFISMVVLIGMINTMFSPSMGLVNYIRDAMGFDRLYYMTIPEVFPHMYVWSGIWKSLGWNSIIFIAALSGVDPQLHESAVIDGASRLQRIMYINLPTISPTIVILLIMQIGNLISVGYEQVYLLQNNLNVEYSEVIATFVYKRGILNRSYSFAAAVGLFNNVINIALLFIANSISRKVSKSGLF